jgi:hypothetical protein
MTRPVFKNSSMNPRISTSGRFITSSLRKSQLWGKGKETSWSYIGFPFVSFIERTPKDPIKRNYTIFPRGQYRFADEDWSEHSKLQPNETKEGCKYCPADHKLDIQIDECSASCAFRPGESFEGTYNDEIGLAKCKYCPAGFFSRKTKERKLHIVSGWMVPVGRGSGIMQGVP